MAYYIHTHSYSQVLNTIQIGGTSVNGGTNAESDKRDSCARIVITSLAMTARLEIHPARANPRSAVPTIVLRSSLQHHVRCYPYHPYIPAAHCPCWTVAAGRMVYQASVVVVAVP